MLTAVRLLSGVRADVLLEVAELREATVTHLTLVRLNACVDASVLRQV